MEARDRDRRPSPGRRCGRGLEQVARREAALRRAFLRRDGAETPPKREMQLRTPLVDPSYNAAKILDYEAHSPSGLEQ